MSFIAQEGLISGSEQGKEEELKKHTEGEQIKELVDRLVDQLEVYEQEIYETDLQLQHFKNEMSDLEEELCEKEQYIKELETTIEGLRCQCSKEADRK